MGDTSCLGEGEQTKSQCQARWGKIQSEPAPYLGSEYLELPQSNFHLPKPLLEKYAPAT